MGKSLMIFTLIGGLIFSPYKEVEIYNLEDSRVTNKDYRYIKVKWKH